jgi:hypothetical protein
MSSFVRHAAGNWEFSGIFTAESGAPLNPTAGTDQSRTGIGSYLAQYSGANAYQKGSCPGVTTPCRQWLNHSAFSLPAVGTFGNVGRGQFIGPDFWNWDMGVFKNIRVTEKWAVQLRGELFNTLNHVNFSTDNIGSRAKSPIQANPSITSFGQIQAAKIHASFNLHSRLSSNALVFHIHCTLPGRGGRTLRLRLPPQKIPSGMDLRWWLKGTQSSTRHALHAMASMAA